MNNRGLTTFLMAGLVAGAGVLTIGLGVGSGQPQSAQPAHAEAQPAKVPAAPATAPAAEAAPADDGLSEAIAAIYAVISGPAGQTRDWDAFNAMFTEDAVMGVCVLAGDGKPRYRGFTPAEYVEMNAKFLEEEGFFEHEIRREVQRFGPLAHVWSVYGSRHTPDGEVFQRGINSIQLANMGEAGWKVRSIFWTPETPGNPLPKGDQEAPGAR